MKNSEKHLKEILNGFDTVMMITRSNGVGVHARPMRIAEIGEDGGLYFATSVQSPKVQEIQNDASVSLMFQSPEKFVALHGKARVERDAGLIERLWSEDWRVWFPKGKNDPSLVILKVEPRETIRDCKAYPMRSRQPKPMSRVRNLKHRLNCMAKLPCSGRMPRGLRKIAADTS